MSYTSFRERDRMKNRTTRPGMAPMRKPLRVKQQPPRGRACRVKNALGEYYDIDFIFNILDINPNNPDGHLFPSRSKAGRAVWRTIKRWVSEGLQWEGREFILEDV